jgi:hypothetical protein
MGDRRSVRHCERQRKQSRIFFAMAAWVASAFAQGRFGGLLPGELAQQA